MKFGRIAAGTRQTKPVPFEAGGQKYTPAVRALSAMEEIDVEAAAIAVCLEKKAEPKQGSPIYTRARAFAVLARAYLDPDTLALPTPEPFFEFGADAIGELDPETVAYLHEMQDAWQEEVSPGFHHKTTSELLDIVRKLAEDEHDPLEFGRLSAFTRLTLVPFMAKLLRASPVLNSSPGGDSAPSTSASSSAAPTAPAPTTSLPASSTSPTTTTPSSGASGGGVGSPSSSDP